MGGGGRGGGACASGRGVEGGEGWSLIFNRNIIVAVWVVGGGERETRCEAMGTGSGGGCREGGGGGTSVSVTELLGRGG